MEEEKTKITLRDLVGDSLYDDFQDFDMSEIEFTLNILKSEQPFDMAHAQMLQQQALYCAQLISNLLGKMVKSASYLDAKVNSVKNKVSLDYKATDGTRTTAEMKKQAGECSPEVEKWLDLQGKARGSKAVLEKKYDLLIKSHYFFKEIAIGMKKALPTENSGNSSNRNEDNWR